MVNPFFPSQKSTLLMVLLVQVFPQCEAECMCSEWCVSVQMLSARVFVLCEHVSERRPTRTTRSPDRWDPNTHSTHNHHTHYYYSYSQLHCGNTAIQHTNFKKKEEEKKRKRRRKKRQRDSAKKKKKKKKMKKEKEKRKRKRKERKRKSNSTAGPL